jgi:phosphatidylglycerophosphatase A
VSVIRAGRALAVAIGTGFGAGFSPVASGTVGSLLGVALYFPLAAGGLPAAGVAVALLFPAGVWAAGVCGKRYGAHDHGRIVVDEIVGQVIALAGLPARPWWLLAGFLLFRLFDIWKPFPADRIDERWHTPLGVMADDVVAGIYANLSLRLVRAFLGA